MSPEHTAVVAAQDRLCLLIVGWITLNVVRRRRRMNPPLQLGVAAAFYCAVAVGAWRLSIPWYSPWLSITLIIGAVALWAPPLVARPARSAVLAACLAAGGVCMARSYETMRVREPILYWFMSGEIAAFALLALISGIVLEVILNRVSDGRLRLFSTDNG